MVLGQPVYLAVKANGDNSMLVKRRAPEVVVGCRAARPVCHGESYTCLNSNSQSDKSGSHRIQRLITCAARARNELGVPGDLYESRRWAMSLCKGMNGAPTTHYHRPYYRTMGLPTEREFYGDGASIVVCGRESRPLGEGKQVISTHITGRYV